MLVVVVVAFFGATSTAEAHSSHYNAAKARYYHANGIVKWIGKHAKLTQYHPNPRKKAHWQRAVKFWKKVRHDAWVEMHPAPVIPDWLTGAFSCIHRYEGAWTANTGNGYYGGLQMDIAFQSRYGGTYLDRWGTADNWPVWAQLDAAARAYRSGRGFGPWPNTARFCGLL
jgi:hypothetical protein